MARPAKHEESMKTARKRPPHPTGFLFTAASSAIRYKGCMNELPLHAAQHLTLPPAQEQAHLDHERRDLLLLLLQSLSPREERVIKMRYGIGFDREYSLREVGERFGVSLERIRQIEVRALRRLRSARPAPSTKLIAA
jgi:RNA polymerase sigma factor (sigma-70 family)